MVLTLNPLFPAVYRSPTSLQFGVSRPLVILRDVDAATERMVAALGKGVSLPGLTMIARSCGASTSAVEVLLRTLHPVLGEGAGGSLSPSGNTPPRASARVVVCGSGRTATKTAELLAASALRVQTAASADDARETSAADLAVIIGHFVIAPELHGLWLRRDTPHLPVVLGDTEITIGPFIEPGLSACLYCLAAHARDADPAWPAIASQVWGRRSPADIALHASEIAAMVTRLVLARGVGGTGVASAQLVMQTRSGATTERNFDPHPACGCLRAGHPNAQVLTESGSVYAELPHGSR